MATVYGVNATKINSPSHQNTLSPDEQGGRIRWIHDSYEAAGVAKGSFIYLGNKVPAGAQILPGSKLYHDALGANSELAVGTSELGVDLAASEVTTSAGTIEFNNTVDLFGTKGTAAKDIIVTISGAGAITGTVRLSLMYAMA